MRCRASGSKDGVATVLALGSVAVLLAVTLVAVVVAQVVAARHVAAAAADLGALAGAGAVRSQPVLGLWWRPEVTARAGPAS